MSDRTERDAEVETFRRSLYPQTVEATRIGVQQLVRRPPAARPPTSESTER